MAKKTKQQEKIIKKLEKGGKYGMSGESKKRTEQGAVDAPPRKRKNTRLIQKQGLRSPKHKSVSQSDRGRKSILWNPLRGQNPESGNADSGTP